MRCSYCGKKTHTIKNCPSTANGQSNRLHMFCTYCGSKQHNITACPKTFSGNAARAWHPNNVADDFVED
jgi:hypothetical protein